MDSQSKTKFAEEFNKSVGDLFHSMRNKAGFSLDRLAEKLAASRLEKVKRIEAGKESPRGLELLELIEIYDADYIEVNTSIHAIAAQARAKVRSSNDSSPVPPEQF